MVHLPHNISSSQPKNKILKSFMKIEQAELGHNPSFVWRSLLAARALIKEGSRWKVGDGRRFEVSTHDWLSHASEFVADSIMGLRVRDLIDEDTRQWDKGKLSAIFSPRTQDKNSIHTFELSGFSGHPNIYGRRINPNNYQ